MMIVAGINFSVVQQRCKDFSVVKQLRLQLFVNY